jgi:hypothetical protein
MCQNDSEEIAREVLCGIAMDDARDGLRNASVRSMRLLCFRRMRLSLSNTSHAYRP